MRDDWLFLDAIKPFLPWWLAKSMSLTVIGVLTLALLFVVVLLKAGR